MKRFLLAFAVASLAALTAGSAWSNDQDDLAAAYVRRIKIKYACQPGIDTPAADLVRCLDALGILVPKEDLVCRQWKEGRADQVLPIPKTQLPTFIEAVVKTSGKRSSAKEQVAIRKELTAHPESISKFVPDAHLSACGDNYLFY